MRKILLIISISVIYSPVFADSPVLVFPANDSINAPTEIGFFWTHINGATYYDLEMDTTQSFNSPLYRIIAGSVDYSTTSSGTVLGDTIMELYFGKKYYWKVTPRNLQGSTPSEIRNFTTVSKGKIKSPLNLAAPIPINGPVVVNHDLGTHIHYLEIGNTSVFTSPIYSSYSLDFVLVQDQVGIDYNPTGLQYNTTYYARTKSYNQSDSSEWSEVVEFSTIEDPSLVSEFKTQQKIFYPNPAADYIQFDFVGAGTILRISNIQGQELVCIGNLESNKKIDLSSLSQGVYVLMLQTTEGNQSLHKLIISR